MPLVKGKSEKSFVKNLKTEMEHGKPQKQSLAIAYAMKRKAQRKKMADGGEAPTPEPTPIFEDSQDVLDSRKAVSDSFNSAVKHAEGGEVCEHCGSEKIGEVEEQDLVDRIMEKRSEDFSSEDRLADGGYLEDDEMYPHAKNKMFDVTNKYSEGGRVANSDEIEAGFDPNEFDDLHLRDDLESSYGEDDNAGDDLGNKQEDEDRADLVDRIMLKNFKQKIPRGYPGR